MLETLAFAASLACKNGEPPAPAPYAAAPLPAASTPAPSATRAAPLPPAPEPGALPQRISIRSVNAGFAGSPSTFEIQRGPDGFVAGERPIAGALVQALLDAATAPAEPELKPERLLPFIGDLRVELERDQLLPLTAEHFAPRALQPENLGLILQRMQADFVSDDYPEVEVELAWPGGATLGLLSRSRDPLMLPWTSSGSRTTWNPDLSRAITALLPPRFAERERIAGTYLTRAVASFAERLFADEIGAEEGEARFARELQPLRRRFEIVSGGLVRRFRFNTHHFDRVWCGELFATADAPFGFSLCLSADDQLASPRSFLHEANGLLARIREVPWLRRFAATHPHAKVLIEYRDDRSLGPHALETAARVAERPSASPEAAALPEDALARSIGVTIRMDEETATWVVLPDDRGLFLDGKPFGAVEPQLQGGRVIQADGSGGVTERERVQATRRAERRAALERRARSLQDSVRSSFERAQQRLHAGTLTKEEQRALSAPLPSGPPPRGASRR